MDQASAGGEAWSGGAPAEVLPLTGWEAGIMTASQGTLLARFVAQVRELGQ
jgi:hypothetical protein